MILKTVFDGIRFRGVNQFFSGIPIRVDRNFDRFWRAAKHHDLTLIKARLIASAAFNLRDSGSVFLRAGWRAFFGSLLFGLSSWSQS